MVSQSFYCALDRVCCGHGGQLQCKLMLLTKKYINTMFPHNLWEEVNPAIGASVRGAVFITSVVSDTSTVLNLSS